MAQRPAGRRGGQLYVYIVLGILVVALLGWGGSQSLGVGRRASIGSVDGLDIPAQSYANAIRSEMNEIGQQGGQPVAFAQLQAAGFDRQVLAGLVTQRVLDAQAASLGLSVGDERLARRVRSVQAFQGPDGQFDRAAYREQLRRNGLDEAAFEAALREDSARSILQAAVTAGVPEQATLGQALAEYGNETRDVTWAFIAADSLAATLQPPTEQELHAFHDQNPDLFTTPETRTVSYAALTPEMMRDSVPVDDAAVRALYDERRDQFVQEERRLVERLVFPDGAAADAARAQLDAGSATFEQLVAARGLQLSNVDLGDVSRADLGAAADPVFGAAVGDVVGPLPSDLGPALFRVNAVLAADETPFEEAAPQLRAELQDRAARDAIADVVPAVQDLVAGGAAVADVAAQTDLEPGTLRWSEGVTDGIAAYQEVRDAVAAGQPGDLPNVVTLADGGVVALHVDAVAPAALRPFEEARADVEAAWRARRLDEVTLAEATSKATGLVAGGSFESEGLDARTEAGLTRRSFVEGAPEGFTAAVFAMAPGEARALPAPDGAVVVRLDAVTPAAPADASVATEAQAIAGQARDAVAADLFDAYARQLQVEAEVRVDDAAVQAVNAQFN